MVRVEALPSKWSVPRRRAAGLPAAFVAMLAGLAGPNASARDVNFSRDIRPILSRNCFACHGPDEHDRQAGLRLDDRAAAVAAGDGGIPAIVPHDPAASPLVARIHARDPGVVMPPPHTNRVLTPAEKELLETWIAAGAPYTPHWATVPPEHHDPPPVRDETWPVNWIDRFVLGRLETEGIPPAPDADPVTLVRRLHVDLTGLPPAPADVAAYLADARPDRHQRLVDRLLASPRHAERMASWWLDLVRYADTVGYHGDQTHNASPYRDWVIKAFLDDVPFDRFTLLQLAGDLVGPAPGEHPDDPVLASGYHRLLQTTHEGGLQPGEYRAIYQADRIRNLAAVWMGATLGCAQCHDHKYDPYTSRDFYALGGFFADIDDEAHFTNGGNSLPTRRDPEVDVVGPFDRDEAGVLDERIATLERFLPPLVLPPRAQPEPEPDAVVAARLELDTLRARRQALPRRLMVTRSLPVPRTVRILPRGDWLDDSGAVVAPAIPAAFGTLAPGSAARPTRADLARWLVTAGGDGGVGEFTARVVANRLWAQFFGAGLCRSVDDFGGQGEPPDHPELLDRLALEMVHGGWSVRSLIRTIVTSRTYRQSSAADGTAVGRDPDNRLLARQGRWRLPAEGVRDAALAASGLLVERLGGPSVHPYQPAGYYQHLNFPQREYASDEDERQWRRGLYVHWQRMFLHPQLRVFDAPTREECTAARSRSNTPQAALVLLNDPTFVEAARRLAERVLSVEGDSPRIAAVWRLVLSRDPAVAETVLAQGLLDRRRREYAAAPEAAAALVGVGLAPRTTAVDDPELAAWTAVARAVLNLHEAITRY
jgi:hypothetical protein